MEFGNFEELTKKTAARAKKRVVLAGAQDAHSLEAVLKAAADGAADYILVGDKEKIARVVFSLGAKIDMSNVVGAKSEREAAFKSVELIRLKAGDFLMKGKMQTGTLLKEVVDKETGIGGGGVMSHVAIMEIPGYRKLVGFSDGGMLLYPTFEQKKALLKNALELFRGFGYDSPKVAVLAPAETPNPKLPDAADAAALKEAALAGKFGKCVVEGPISFDLAFSAKAAKIKGYESPVCGDVDIAVVPNITTGNAVTKALIMFANSKMAGCVLGAKVPIALNSRGASVEEKLASLLICAATA